MSTEYKCTEVTALDKDITVLRKKYQTTVQKGARVEENLLHALEALVQETSLDQQRWFSTAREKVVWCADVAGDKYSIEAKLATIQELMRAADDGQQKTETMVEKIEMLKTVSAQARHTQLDRDRKSAEEECRLFLEDLQTTK